MTVTHLILVSATCFKLFFCLKDYILKLPDYYLFLVSAIFKSKRFNWNFMKFSVIIILFLSLFGAKSFPVYGQHPLDSTDYIVAGNETVHQISLQHHVNIDSIRRWNNLDKNYTVVKGQRLILNDRKIIAAFEKKTDQFSDTSQKLLNSSLTGSLVDPLKRNFLPLFSDPINSVNSSSSYEKIRLFYNKSNYLIRIIFFLNLIFLIIAIVLSIIILFRRLREGYIESRRTLCRDKYRDFITEWIYSDHSNHIPELLIKELKDWVNRDVFTSELLSLHTNLIGESANKLMELFNLAELPEYSIRKVNSRFWHLKAKGFREIAQMKISEGNQLIPKYLNSKNTILRIEAQLAWIQLNPNDPLSFCDDPKIQLTEWEQLNILDSLKKIENIPDFGRWLKSSNKSVLLFAIKMSGIFKQFDNIDLVTQHLNNPDFEIRHEAICALGKMAVPSPVIKLQQLFTTEELDNRTEILRSLIMMADDANIPFFEKVILNETEVNLRILSAKGLILLNASGKERLESLFFEADAVLKKIIIHAKDDKI